MLSTRHHTRAALTLGAALLLLSTTACSSGGGDSGSTSISYLAGGDADSVARAKELIAAFEKVNPDITVKLDALPPGSEGDNLVKTKLSTGEMDDVFNYNDGSLLQALAPDSTLVDLSDQPWVSKVDPDFVKVASTKKGMYGAPLGTSLAGGILYNKKVYERLGLSVPTSWAQFMDNSEKIKAAGGVTPILQAYGDEYTAQLWVLSDFANVSAQDPKWADDYTANKAKYVDEPALAGFQHEEQAAKAGLFNEDYPSMTNEQAIKALADGTGAQYPMQSAVIGTVVQNYPDKVADIGFFAQPADDPADTRLTMWMPNALYIPKTTEDEKLTAAKKFVDFLVTSPEACAVQQKNGVPAGPYVIDTCQLTGDVPEVTQDVQRYVDAGQSSLALEFISPIKGPNMPNITGQVGSQQVSAVEGARMYDQDVEKQAQQLGLEGW